MAAIRNESPLVAVLEKLSDSSWSRSPLLCSSPGAFTLTPGRSAVLIGVLYGLGTSSLSVSSQVLWRQAASQLALSFVIYCLLRGLQQTRWVALAGFPLAFAILSRPTNIFLAMPIAAYVIFHHSRRTIPFLLTDVRVGAFHLWYNLTYFGQAFLSQFPLHRSDYWVTPFWRVSQVC